MRLLKESTKTFIGFYNICHEPQLTDEEVRIPATTAHKRKGEKGKEKENKWGKIKRRKGKRKRIRKWGKIKRRKGKKGIKF